MNVFGYGPWAYPDIMGVLLGRVPTHQDGILENFEIGIVANNTLPGAFPSNGHNLLGVIYTDINENDLKVLNTYHDSFFEFMDGVAMIPRQKSEKLFGACWIIPQRHTDIMAPTIWNDEAFKRNTHARFLIACRDFRREVVSRGLRSPFEFTM